MTIIAAGTGCEDALEACALVFEADSDGLFGAADFLLSEVKLTRSRTYASFNHSSIQTIKFIFLLDVIVWSFGEHILKVVLTRSGSIYSIFSHSHIPACIPNSWNRCTLH